MSNNQDFLTKLASAETHNYLANYGAQTNEKDYARITKKGRLRLPKKETRYNEYYDVRHMTRNGEATLRLQHLSTAYLNRSFLRKSSTKKAGGFIVIKDICENIFGPESEEGWHYELEEISRDEASETVYYKIKLRD